MDSLDLNDNLHRLELLKKVLELCAAFIGLLVLLSIALGNVLMKHVPLFYKGTQS